MSDDASLEPPPALPCVVIPSWNTRALLLDCLQSLRDDRGKLACSVVVVDNASEDGSADAVAREAGDVTILRNSSNLGFAGAANTGLTWALEHGHGPILLLNADTLCPPKALMGLCDRVTGHRRIGAAAPRLCLPDGGIQPYAFGGEPSLGYLLRRGWTRVMRRRALHDWATDEEQDVEFLSFAGVCFSRPALEQVGLLDDGFFMYFEDNDWCIRARRAGWTLRYCPGVDITHIGGASLKQNPTAATAYRRSLKRLYAKHYPRWHGWVLRGLLPLYAKVADPRGGAGRANRI